MVITAGPPLRAALGLFVGVVLMNTAMVCANTVATLLAADALGPTWSGSPSAASVLGTAIGALGLASVMARRGRQMGMQLAYMLAILGAALALIGVVAGA